MDAFAFGQAVANVELRKQSGLMASTLAGPFAAAHHTQLATGRRINEDDRADEDKGNSVGRQLAGIGHGMLPGMGAGLGAVTGSLAGMPLGVPGMAAGFWGGIGAGSYGGRRLSDALTSLREKKYLRQKQEGTFKTPKHNFMMDKDRNINPLFPGTAASQIYAREASGSRGEEPSIPRAVGKSLIPGLAGLALTPIGGNLVGQHMMKSPEGQSWDPVAKKYAPKTKKPAGEKSEKKEEKKDKEPDNDGDDKKSAAMKWAAEAAKAAEKETAKQPEKAEPKTAEKPAPKKPSPWAHAGVIGGSVLGAVLGRHLYEHYAHK